MLVQKKKNKKKKKKKKRKKKKKNVRIHKRTHDALLQLNAKVRWMLQTALFCKGFKAYGKNLPDPAS